MFKSKHGHFARSYKDIRRVAKPELAIDLAAGLCKVRGLTNFGKPLYRLNHIQE